MADVQRQAEEVSEVAGHAQSIPKMKLPNSEP